MNTMIYLHPKEPEFDFDTYTMTQRICAEAVELQDEVIVSACIRAAREAGITDLFLIDRQFVLDALREKIEREKEDPS